MLYGSRGNTAPSGKTLKWRIKPEVYLAASSPVVRKPGSCLRETGEFSRFYLFVFFPDQHHSRAPLREEHHIPSPQLPTICLRRRGTSHFFRHFLFAEGKRRLRGKEQHGERGEISSAARGEALWQAEAAAAAVGAAVTRPTAAP